MAIPDWRSIGRHLKKRLDEILDPSPRSRSPTPSERRAQREEDATLRGLVYFDNFDEIMAWSLTEADPIQVSNTPLLRRSEPPSSCLADGTLRSKVLLCHDYKGGYNDYESVRPMDSDHEEYSCRYLQYIDTFVYFSHKLVCCPPASWVNTCHRNGVKILGTFIVEPQTHGMERMLEHDNGSYWLASQLTAMAEEYGFDGWLLNIEKRFPGDLRTHDAISQLLAFIRSLKQKMGAEKTVIWYDALASDNKVKYQNGLTEKNLEFAKAAGALFTNYKWTEAKARNTVGIAKREGINLDDIYFGVDVWAQNVGMKPPRITYPVKGGGGTGTGLAVEELASLGLSTVIFAPGWTFEHFEPSKSSDVDLCIWQGGDPPSPLPCSCNPQTPHDLANGPHTGHPITLFAREFPAGSNEYFFTNFHKAFDTAINAGARSVLGRQSILPKCLHIPKSERANPEKGGGHQAIYAEHSQDFTIWTKFIGPNPSFPSGVNLSLELFSLSMPRVVTEQLRLQLTYVLHHEIPSDMVQLELILRYSVEGQGHPEPQYEILSPYEFHKGLPNDHVYTRVFYTMPQSPDPVHLTAVSFRCSFSASPSGLISSEPRRLVTLKELSIFPTSSVLCLPYIENIRIIPFGDPPNVHRRLAWEWDVFTNGLPRSEAVPWSPTTGPFSHFRVSLDGVVLGDVSATRFVLRDGDLNEASGARNDKEAVDADREVDIVIEGFSFSGGSVRSAQKVAVKTLMWERGSDDWVRV